MVAPEHPNTVRDPAEVDRLYRYWRVRVMYAMTTGYALYYFTRKNISMAAKPIIFALANPDPEIDYPTARATRPDAIVATGRSDYNNQVNNVLGFPFIFRGALDVRATQINEQMKVAAAHALAELARKDVPQVVNAAAQVLSLRPELDTAALVELLIATATRSAQGLALLDPQAAVAAARARRPAPAARDRQRQ